MVYMRGQPEDYDDWAALPGCSGWSYEDILPYFRRSERYTLGESNRYHSTEGELDVTHIEMKYPISEAYIEAAVSAGIPRNEDINGEVQEGIGYMQVNMRGGKRWSSADASSARGVRTSLRAWLSPCWRAPTIRGCCRPRDPSRASAWSR